MSDLGFDAFSLDGEDAGAHAHPLEIARDLIATGKPRSALEVLSMHHDELVDRSEYLLLCAEAWWMDQDFMRAQQALLGAARLAPADPAPMQMLGELLRERGEDEKAERAFAKARTLLLAHDDVDDDLDEDVAELDEDLIAFAERQERTARAGLTPKQILAGLGAVILLAGLIAGIVVLTRPASTSDPNSASQDDGATQAAAAIAEEPARSPDPDVDVEAASTSAWEPEPESELEARPQLGPEPEPEPALEPKPAAEPASASTSTQAPPAAAAKPAPKPRAKPKPSRTRTPAVAPTEVDPEPDPAVVQQELSTLDPRTLTRRADDLHARGHTGVAAIYYRRALELDPDYAPAMVGIGRSIVRAEKYGDAMKNATRALQLARGVDARPGLEAEAIYQMARVHLHRGELDAARRLLRQSTSLPGTPAAAWFYLGEALWNDNSPAAREAYERYLELVPTGSLADRARRAIR